MRSEELLTKLKTLCAESPAEFCEVVMLCRGCGELDDLARVDENLAALGWPPETRDVVLNNVGGNGIELYFIE